MAAPEVVQGGSEVALEPSLRGAVLDPRSPASERLRVSSLVPRRRRGWLIRRGLAAADMVGLSLAFVTADVLFSPGPDVHDHVNPAGEYAFFAATLPLWIVVAKLYGLYDHDEERTDHSTADDFTGILNLVTVGAWMVLGGSYAVAAASVSTPRMLAFWMSAVVLVTAARATARALCRRHESYIERTVIVGAGDVGRQLAAKLRRHSEYGLDVVGFVDDSPRPGIDEDPSLPPVLGGRGDLERLIEELDVGRVVVAFSSESSEQTVDLLRSLRGIDVQVDVVPRLFEILAPGVGVHTIEGVPLLGLPPARLSRSSALLKRTLDMTLLAVALPVAVPLFVIIALAIKLETPGPVFFRQERRGRDETTFRIWKFRTMSDDADRRKAEFAHLNKHNGDDPRMFKIENDPRVTRVGRFLRRFSLDELPQLLNVATGQMSLVGPRPLILEEDRFVEDWARTRLEIKPGMTGLWQVLGRSDIPFDEMVRMDYLYVTTWSLWRDLKLMAKTVPALARRGDA
jgi:exopolysaccharide biosynthesis polyprenyl glycosylphosphotransferase